MAKRILEKVGNLVATIGGPTVSKLQVRAEELVEKRAPRLAEILKATRKDEKKDVYKIQPVEDEKPAKPRSSGRKTVAAQPVAAKRATKRAPKPEFKVKRGQKHLHTGK